MGFLAAKTLSLPPLTALVFTEGFLLKTQSIGRPKQPMRTPKM